VVPDAAARLSDIRDALFDVSQEVRTRPIARPAGPDAPAPADLHAPYGRSDRRRFRSGDHYPAQQQQGRSSLLVDKSNLRLAGRALLVAHARAHSSVASV